MSDWKEKTDFEINKLTANIWLQCDYHFNDDEKSVDLVGYSTYLGPHGMPDERLEKYGEYDPCNNPSDAWPIIELIFDKGVTLIINDTGVATGNLGEDLNGESLDVDCKPLRAAMIVYLEINGVKP